MIYQIIYNSVKNVTAKLLHIAVAFLVARSTKVKLRPFIICPVSYFLKEILRDLEAHREAFHLVVVVAFRKGSLQDKFWGGLAREMVQIRAFSLVVESLRVHWVGF